MKVLMKRSVRKHFLYGIVICLFIFGITVFDIGCPLFYIFRVPCPACGSTRALLSLCLLDIQGYFHYHPLALPMGVAIWLMLHRELFRAKKLLYSFVFSVLGINMLLYVWRFDFLMRIVAE